MAELYINGTGCISPQLSFDNSVFLPEIKEYTSNSLFCIDPDYSAFFDTGTLRRMSRIIKFATGAAFIAMRDAGIKAPGGISTGTGFGLLDNSAVFLKNVIEQDESLASPTSFVQSTHNTVGGIIALMTQSHVHNNTFSQKGVSFESALNDARILITEGKTDNYLIGGFDELTSYSIAIMSRMGILKKYPCHNLELLSNNDDGITAGEGASFFVLSKEKSANTYGRLVDSKIIFNTIDSENIKAGIIEFLDTNGLSIKGLDIIISGLCGDKERDMISRELNQHLFTTQSIAVYKHLCGEYMTSSSFALWLASKMIKTVTVPQVTLLVNRHRKPENILIYNSYKNDHSLILLQSC